MTEKMMTQVFIGGIDVTDPILNWTINRSFGDFMHTIDLEFTKKLTDLITLAQGVSIQVFRGVTTPSDEFVLDGYVDSFTETGTKVQVKAKDKMGQLGRRIVTKIYLNMKVSDIILDLVTVYGGLNADGTTIQDTGSSSVISKFVCRDAYVSERCQALANTMNWQIYYRPDTNKVYFEPKGFNLNTNTLTVGDNLIQVPKWTEDRTELANSIIAEGSYQDVETTEFFNGTGALLTFTLQKTPESTKVYLSSVLQTGQVEGSSVSANYYVDKVNKKIRFAVAPPVGVNNVEIRYTYSIPTPVKLENNASIAIYGRWEKKILLTDVRSTQDAELRVGEILGRFSTPFYSTTLSARDVISLGLLVGQKIQVVDDINNKNALYVITHQNLRFPYDYDEIVVGDKMWTFDEFISGTENRIKRLEEMVTGTQDYLLNVLSQSSNILMKPRFMRIDQTNIAGDVLIWGNPAYGVWGIGKWGSSSASSFILGNPDAGILGIVRLGSVTSVPISIRLINPNNTFAEEFYDTEFKGTTGLGFYLDSVAYGVLDTGTLDFGSAVTADWDTVNKKLFFDPGEQATSALIYTDAVDIASAKLICDCVNFIIATYGTARYDSSLYDDPTGGTADHKEFLSADDGLTFEEVTDGVTHAFSTVGQKLRWKIINTDTVKDLVVNDVTVTY
jgi:hypothetical protein